MHQRKRIMVHNSQGYTLLEALFSFTVFVLLSQILLLVIFWIQQMNNSFNTAEEVAWEIFVQDIQQSFRNVVELKVSNDAKTMEVFYADPKEDKKINRSGDVLRLIVNNQGNIPLLIGIKGVSFRRDGQFIIISVIFQTGMEKERRFFVQTTIE